MPTENGQIKLRILVDESSVEVFVNEGKSVFSEVIFPDPASRAMSFYTKGGNVKVVSLKVYKLGSVWNPESGSATRIALDTSDRELGVGQSETVQAIVENGPGNGAQPLNWKSSNEDAVIIKAAGNSRATLEAKKAGESIITVSTPNGKASASFRVKVFGGTFHTNLSGWMQDVSMAYGWLAGTEFAEVTPATQIMLLRRRRETSRMKPR